MGVAIGTRCMDDISGSQKPQKSTRMAGWWPKLALVCELSVDTGTGEWFGCGRHVITP